MKFTNSELWTIINALRVSAEQYERDAQEFRRQIPTADSTEPLARLVRQFEDQATVATALAERMENEA